MDNGALSEIFLPLVISAIAYFHYRSSVLPPAEKYRTFWPRFFAPAIDSLVLWPFLWGCQLALARLHLAAPVRTFLALAACTLPYLYAIYFHGRCGQTPGKRACKVKVVHVDGEGPITYAAALIRDAIPLALSVAVFFGLPGAPPVPTGHPAPGSVYLLVIALAWIWAEVITMLFNPRRRAVHDFLAQTVVIRTNVRNFHRPTCGWAPPPARQTAP